MFHVRQKICFCRMLISDVHKSIIVMNFIVGVCSKARPRNFGPDNTAARLTLLSFKATQTNCKTVLKLTTFIFQNRGLIFIIPMV